MRALALALALFLAACGQAPDPGPPRPALWKIADKDTTLYLFGTIHILPQGYDWETPKIDAALGASQELILEAVLEGRDEEVGTVMRNLASDSPGPPLSERVAAKDRGALDAAIARADVPRGALDGLESWAVALILASAQIRDLPAKSDYGIEPLLTRKFRAAGKRVEGFETLEQQFGYFDALPAAAQARFLQSVIEDKADPRAEYEAMISSWRAGDLGRIALSFDDEAKLTPELKEALLIERNRRWTAQIVQRMAAPGTVFVAVGAGHLAGNDSVIAMLAAKGLKAERLQ